MKDRQIEMILLGCQDRGAIDAKASTTITSSAVARQLGSMARALIFEQCAAEQFRVKTAFGVK